MKLAVCELYIRHRALFRPHSRSHNASFQRRACGACSAKQKIPVADDQFAVCPDIQKHADLLLPVQIGCENSADNIPAQIIRPRRKAVHHPTDGKAETSAGIGRKMCGPERIRGRKYTERIQPVKEMHHRRISRNRHTQTRLRPDSRLSAQDFHRLQEAVPGSFRQFLQMLRMIFAVKNSCENVCTPGYLTVIDAHFPKCLPASAVHQTHHHRRASQIRTVSIMTVRRISGLQPEGLPSLLRICKRYRNLPSAVFAAGIQHLQNLQRRDHPPKLLPQSILYPLPGGTVVFLRRFFQFQINFLTQAFHRCLLIVLTTVQPAEP